jgi:hypothetical protein
MSSGFLPGCESGTYQPRDGDIVFQISDSDVGRAVRIVTQSDYSHMGIVRVTAAGPVVFEAIGPVAETPLAEWIARGKEGHVVVKRLRNARAILTDAALADMRRVGRAFAGKSYDFCFEWSDERFYCSELVWKIYQRALGIEIGRRQHISEFDLDHREVQQLIARRCPDLLAKADTVISPAAMLTAAALETVYSNR